MTITGGISGNFALSKVGTGQLILPNANPLFTGPTNITAGWVTMQDPDALGAHIPNVGQGGQTLVTVDSLASLELKALVPGTSFTFFHNLALNGQGNLHAFSLISQQGALINLGGDNTITGNVSLVGDAGIGVVQVDPAAPSELTITGELSAPVVAAAGINVNVNPSGGSQESDEIIDTGSTSGTITINYDMEAIPDDLRVYYPPVGVPGSTRIFDTGLVSFSGTAVVAYPGAGPANSGTAIEIIMDQGGGSPGTFWTYSATIVPNATTASSGLIKFGAGRLDLQGPGEFSGGPDIRAGVVTVQNGTALGDPGAAGNSTVVEAGAALEVDATVASLNGGQAVGPQILNNPLVLNGSGNSAFGDSALAIAPNIDAAWDGPITLNSNINADFQNTLGGQALDTMTATFLNPITGVNTLTGTNPTVAATTTTTPGESGVNAVQTFGFGGTITGGSFNLAFNNGGTIDYTGTADVQQVSVTGATAGATTFTLTFNGQTTGVIPYTGVAATDATAVQNALNALTSISAPGGSPIGAAVGVTAVGDVFTITFGGALTGFSMPSLTATILAGSGAPTIVTLTNGAGIAWNNNTNNLIANIQNALTALPNIGAGNVQIVNISPIIDVAPDSRFTVTGTIGDALNQTNNGTNLTIDGGGELVLAGNNTYRGTTYVNQGILTIANSAALGSAGTSEVQTVALTGAFPNFTKFTLTFNGQTTPVIDYAANDAATVQAALDELSSIGGVGGTVTVKQTGTVFTITYTGSLTGFNQPQIVPLITSGPGTITPQTTIDGGGGTIVANNAAIQMQGGITVSGEPLVIQGTGAGPQSEVQSDTLSGAMSGTYTLTFDGQTTGSLAYGATAGQVQTALAALSSVNGTGGTITVAVTGVTATTDETQVPTTFLNPVAGATQFTLTFNGVTTTPITYKGTAADEAAIQTALNALSTVGGVGGSISVDESGTSTFETFTFTFQDALADAPQTLLAATVTTTAAVPTLLETVPGNGPTETYSFTFGGTFAGVNRNQITANATGGLTVNTKTIIDGGTANTTPYQWQNIGPAPVSNAVVFTTGGTAQNAVGPITGVTVDKSDPTGQTIYVSTAGGGAWKTVDGGNTWTPLFDNDAATIWGGAIAIAPSDPRIIYFGTGAADNSIIANDYSGTGVYESTDSGQTWSLVVDGAGNNPLNGSAINKIVVDPLKPSEFWVATSDQQLNGVAGTAGVRRFDGSWLNMSAASGTPLHGHYRTPDPGPDQPCRQPGAVLRAGHGNLHRRCARHERRLYLCSRPCMPRPVLSAATFPLGIGGIIKITCRRHASRRRPTPFSLPLKTPPSFGLLDVYVSVDGGTTWKPTKTQPGEYLLEEGDYANTIIAQNANIVYVAGVDQGGGNQLCLPQCRRRRLPATDISKIAGIGPNTYLHSMSLDSNNNLIVGTDGGVWRYNVASATWTDLNGSSGGRRNGRRHHQPDQSQRHPGLLNRRPALSCTTGLPRPGRKPSAAPRASSPWQETATAILAKSPSIPRTRRSSIKASICLLFLAANSISPPTAAPRSPAGRPRRSTPALKRHIPIRRGHHRHIAHRGGRQLGGRRLRPRVAQSGNDLDQLALPLVKHRRACDFDLPGAVRCRPAFHRHQRHRRRQLRREHDLRHRRHDARRHQGRRRHLVHHHFPCVAGGHDHLRLGGRSARPRHGLRDNQRLRRRRRLGARLREHQRRPNLDRHQRRAVELARLEVGHRSAQQRPLPRDRRRGVCADRRRRNLGAARGRFAAGSGQRHQPQPDHQHADGRHLWPRRLAAGPRRRRPGGRRAACCRRRRRVERPDLPGRPDHHQRQRHPVAFERRLRRPAHRRRRNRRPDRRRRLPGHQGRRRGRRPCRLECLRRDAGNHSGQPGRPQPQRAGQRLHLRGANRHARWLGRRKLFLDLQRPDHGVAGGNRHAAAAGDRA